MDISNFNFFIPCHCRAGSSHGFTPRTIFYLKNENYEINRQPLILFFTGRIRL